MNQNTLGARLRLAMKERHVTQTELSLKIGITQTSISNFCTNAATPRQHTLISICNALNINESWLRDGLGEMEKQTPEAVTAAIAKEYGLKPYAARLVGAVAQSVKVLTDEQLKTLVERLIAEMQDEPESEPLMVALRLYNDAAAAGDPLYGESDFEQVEFPADTVPDGTDYAVKVSGESMMPEINDGDIVFVNKKCEIAEKNIVIAWIDGEGTVCKRAHLQDGQLTELESVNPAYQNITGDRLKNVRIYGVVIGKA